MCRLKFIFIITRSQRYPRQFIQLSIELYNMSLLYYTLVRVSVSTRFGFNSHTATLSPPYAHTYIHARMHGYAYAHIHRSIRISIRIRACISAKHASTYMHTHTLESGIDGVTGIIPGGKSRF